MCIMEQPSLTKEQTTMLIMGMYHIMFVNELVDYVLTDFSAVIRKQKFFRQDVKYRYNLFLATKKEYNHSVQYCLDKEEGGSLFGDVCDYYIDHIKADYQILQYTIKNELLKKVGFDQAEYLTYMVMLDHLFDFARQNYYNWRQYHKKNLPAGIYQYGSFSNLDITYIANTYSQLAWSIVKASKYQPVEVNDEQMKLAMKIFLKKATDLHLVNDALHAYDDNPDDHEIVTIDPPEFVKIPDQYGLNWQVEEYNGKTGT